MNKEKVTFEEALEKLETVVEELEQQEVPLDKLIQYYKEGMELVKLSNDMLEKAEKEMAEVLKEDGHVEPMEIGEETDL